MKDSVKKYKDISDEILRILSSSDIDDQKIDKCFQDRQMIIDKISEENKIDEFRKIYKEELYKEDENIKNLLQNNINDLKKEIIQHKKSKNVNFNYTNMSKSNLNIFSKKV